MADEARFAFGENWRAFLRGLTEEKIDEAERSLQQALDRPHMQGMRFLDAGSGSGLFSLAAWRMGADVHSFDYDEASVACTRALRKRYGRGETRWRIERGSVLDSDYMASLGQFDVVYSWGVLHHTGDMWKAFDHIRIPAGPGSLLYIAIYNDQGLVSRMWHRVKRIYVQGRAGRWAVLGVFLPFFFFRTVAASLVRYRHPYRYFTEYQKNRGMSVWHDWIDWLGGYPFQVARPAAVQRDFQREGFVLKHLKRTRRMGCNEFVFQKALSP